MIPFRMNHHKTGFVSIDPPVRQEFLEIAPHRPIGRGFRRSQIHQQDANFTILNFRMIGRPEC